ncbi:MAG: hypothetical protein C6Y20_12795 [Tagaea sp. CACIAM 22H2]|nr:hypothetical protein [Tagaea sp. CACIAM 22H2]
MAAPSSKPASKPNPAAKKAPPAKGKAAPADDKKDAAAPAPAPKSVLQRYRMVLFAALGTAFVATLATGAWVVYFRAPIEIDPPAPPPPALKPTPPTVVREGDLDDDLWRRMGVRPNSN